MCHLYSLGLGPGLIVGIVDSALSFPVVLVHIPLQISGCLVQRLALQHVVHKEAAHQEKPS